MAAVKIQKVVRNFLQKCRDKKQNQAAMVIQAVWRGHAVRNGLRREKRARLQASQHQAATLLQVGGFCMFIYLQNRRALCCCNTKLFFFHVFRPIGECSWP